MYLSKTGSVAALAAAVLVALPPAPSVQAAQAAISPPAGALPSTPASSQAASVAGAGPHGYVAAWEQIKMLSGTWTSHVVGRDDGGESIIAYHVTGGEVVVFEEFVGDTPDGVRDMATAYHLDGDGLVATHYCGAGNQPRMRAASWDPETRVLRFDFWDITHQPDPSAYYTTNIELYFEDADNVELRFRGSTAGETGEWQVHRMRRLTRRSHERETDES